MKESNKYIQTERKKKKPWVGLLLSSSLYLTSSLLSFTPWWFYLPVCSVIVCQLPPVVPKQISTTISYERRLAGLTGCTQSIPCHISMEERAIQMKVSVAVCLIYLIIPLHRENYYNWVILTNPTQERSGSMEMFSVWVLIFSATSLLRDSKAVWHQAQPWVWVDSELWRHFFSDEVNTPIRLHSELCAFMSLHI